MAAWLLLAALAATAAGLCGEDADCQHETATKFAPVFRLDKDTLKEDRCLPGHPATVYWERKAGNTEIICESDLSKLENGEVPLFYDYKECDDMVVTITYFIWYSHQAECMKIDLGPIMDEEYGVHKGDWEKIAVHIRMDRVERVRFHQHSGSYTKARKNVEFYDSTHPVAYVGKDSHGSYHDQGGTGNCLYFQDYRRFKDESLKLEGWRFLWNIQNKSENLPEWFHGSRDYYDGFPNPGSLGYNCDVPSCKGLEDYVEATETCTGKVCGCHRSDWCEDVAFGAVADQKACKKSTLNDLTKKGKDLVDGLFGSAQVNSAQQSLNAAARLVLLSCALFVTFG